jgi:hypothetical protein
MTERTITVTLPGALYERAKATAEAFSLSVEEAVTQFIALALPPLENDLPPDLKSDLNALPLYSDAELWQMAHSMMDEEQQIQLETLTELRKHRPLSEGEHATLAHLMEEAQRVMLRKAEAYRLLARRGHHVFASSNALAD